MNAAPQHIPKMYSAYKWTSTGLQVPMISDFCPSFSLYAPTWCNQSSLISNNQVAWLYVEMHCLGTDCDSQSIASFSEEKGHWKRQYIVNNEEIKSFMAYAYSQVAHNFSRHISPLRNQWAPCTQKDNEYLKKQLDIWRVHKKWPAYAINTAVSAAQL